MRKLLFIFMFLAPLLLNMISNNKKSDNKSEKITEDIRNLNWLSGYWASETDDTKMEEFWLRESGNLMLGLHRDRFKSGKTFFEFLRISQTDQGIIYYASPKGREATEFKLKDMSNYKVTFENLDHDFPQRIIYTLKNDTTLISRIEGLISGEIKHREWTWYKNKLYD